MVRRLRDIQNDSRDGFINLITPALVESFHVSQNFWNENSRCGVIRESRLGGVGKGPRVEPQIEKEIIALLPRLRRFALTLTRSVPSADDLVQATIERAIANLDKWQPGTRLDSWMYRIAHNIYRNDVRNEATRGAKLGIVQTDAERALDGERAAVSRLEFSAVTAAIAELPGEQREALLLVAVEGLSYREVAEITGASVAAVTSRIARAREMLRAVVERSG